MNEIEKGIQGPTKLDAMPATRICPFRNQKQNIITHGSLTISKIAGLHTELNARYTKEEVDALVDDNVVIIDSGKKE